MTGTLLPHVTHRLWRCLSLLFSLSKMLRMPCRLQPQHRTAAGTARLLEPGASSQRKLAKWCTGMLVRLGEGTTPRRACLDEQRHDLQWPLAHAPLSNTLQALHQPVVLPPCWAAALIPLPIPLGRKSLMKPQTCPRHVHHGCVGNGFSKRPPLRWGNGFGLRRN